jgi:hypothetical protein
MRQVFYECGIYRCIDFIDFIPELPTLILKFIRVKKITQVKGHPSGYNCLAFNSIIRRCTGNLSNATQYHVKAAF